MTLALSVLAVSASGCDGFAVVPPRAVSAALREAATQGPGTHIRLADVTNFEWDREFWFQCYTQREEAEAALGFKWPDFDKYDLQETDSYSLLVFVARSVVVRVERLRRGDGEFAPEVSGEPFTPETARFVIEKRNGVNLLTPLL